MIMVKFLGDGKGADVKIEGDADVVFTEISCAVLGLIDAASEEAAKDGISREKMLEDTITSIYKISKKNLAARAIRLSNGGYETMKRYIPYIIAALIGFFFSAVVCRIIGFDGYNYGVTDIIMAVLACVIVWCWRGENGIGADAERTLISFKDRTSRRSRR